MINVASEEQINDILNLLNQEEVQMKVVQIIADRLREVFGKSDAGESVDRTADCDKCQKHKKTIESLQGKIGELESRLNQEKATVTRLKSEIVAAQKDLDQSQKEVQKVNGTLGEQKKVNQDLQERLAGYQERFEDDFRIQAAYLDFSESTKNSLSGIFKDTSIQGLIACGIQEGNISNLWDYVKNEVIHGHNPDENHLVMFFEMLFKRFALAYPMYQLELSLVGKEFNNQEHIKHQNSLASSGTIKKVPLPGYRNIRTGKPIKQSVVML